MNTKYNKIFVLAIAGLTLAVIASGNAFAASWTGSDSSQLVSTSYASWSSYVSGYPSANAGSTITWDNSWYNTLSSTKYPLTWVMDQYQQNSQYTNIGTSMTQNQRYPRTSGQYYTASYNAVSPSGWHCMYVGHYYMTSSTDTNPGNGIGSSGPQFVEQDYNTN
jgi:hypothetical protein